MNGGEDSPHDASFDDSGPPLVGGLGAAAAAAAANMEEGSEQVRVGVRYFDAAAFSSTPARFDDDLCFPRLGAAKMVDVPYSDKAASASPTNSIGLSGSAGYSMQSPSSGFIGLEAPGHGDAVPFAPTKLNPSSAPGIIPTGLNTAAPGFVRSSMGRSTLNPNAPSFEPTGSSSAFAAIPASSASVFNSFSATEDDFLSRSAKCFSHPLPASPLAMPAPKTPAIRPTLPVTGVRKTRPCKFWDKTGSCARGADCMFAHGLQDMMRVYHGATYLNVYGSAGNCPERVSYNRAKYKTRPCWYWKPGVPMSCTLGLNCLFAHGKEELRG